jgi:Fur family peroxide stress response transcriptional regulator
MIVRDRVKLKMRRLRGKREEHAMENPDIRRKKMVQRLKEQGMRITPQRLAVLKILAVSHEHPSVEMIYERVRPAFPTTSLATIYKTVNLLKQIGEVVELDFSEASNRYDGNRPYPHPHLICTGCKTVVDPDVATVTELSKELADKTGYKIVNHRLDFFGICPRCQENS